MAILSTVFGRGILGSRPAAGTAGAHYFATDTGLMYRDDGSAWQAVSVAGLVFEFSTTTTDADPGSGKFRFDSATPAAVAELYVSDQAHSSDADLGTVWDNLTGARILVTQADDPAKYLLGEVTADADGTDYWKLTVTTEDSGALIDDGALCSVIVLGGGDGGGGGSAHASWPMRFMWAAAWFSQGVIKTLGPANVSGTADAAVVDSDRMCNKLVPTVTSLSYIRANATTMLGSFSPDMRADLRLVDNDDGIMWLGHIDQSTVPPLGTLTPGATDGIACAMFRVANGTDTNYAFVTSTVAADTVSDTGVPVDGAWHDFRVYTDDGGVTWHGEIDGVLVASHTLTVPPTNVSMYGVLGNSPVASSTREYRTSYFFVFAGLTNL